MYSNKFKMNIRTRFGYGLSDIITTTDILISVAGWASAV